MSRELYMNINLASWAGRSLLVSQAAKISYLSNMRGGQSYDSGSPYPGRRLVNSSAMCCLCENTAALEGCHPHFSHCLDGTRIRRGRVRSLLLLRMLIVEEERKRAGRGVRFFCLPLAAAASRDSRLVTRDSRKVTLIKKRTNCVVCCRDLQ